MGVRVQDVSHLLREAAEARQQGDRAAELRLIDAALAIDAGNPQALNMRGMHALAHGQNSDAVRYFERAAASDPLEPALWMNAASAYRAMSDDAGELASLNRVLDCNQTHFMALLRKAELHERRGENVQAAQIWEGALVVASGMPDLPLALLDRLDEARAFVAAQSKAFAAAVDLGFAGQLDDLSASEHRRVQACIDKMVGRRPKVYANQCAGMHFPFLPADEYFDRDHFPWVAALEAKTPVIRAELEALIASRLSARPYVHAQPGVPDNPWTPLAGSLDWSAIFLWEYGERIEDVCALCPETVAALTAVPQTEIPRRAPTAFFSILAPGKHIPPHTGVTNSRTIIHLPLIVPPGCALRVGGETRAWKVGEAMAFDDTIEHEAWNSSDELRAVLIFDVWNPHMTLAERAMVRRFFEISDANGYQPDAALAH